MTTVYVQVKAVPVKLTIYGHRVDELIGAIHLADRLQEILLILKAFKVQKNLPWYSCVFRS